MGGEGRDDVGTVVEALKGEAIMANDPNPATGKLKPKITDAREAVFPTMNLEAHFKSTYHAWRETQCGRLQ